jgi:hypothetical protein
MATSRPDANHADHGCEVSRSQGRPTIRGKHDGREPAAIQVLARGWYALQATIFGPNDLHALKPDLDAAETVALKRPLGQSKVPADA